MPYLEFKYCITTNGGLGASFVFGSLRQRNRWIVKVLPKLKKKYGPIEYSISTLDNLHIGDECQVCGEGSDVFIIRGVVRYEDCRYGFILDSGILEEVAKCYRKKEVE